MYIYTLLFIPIIITVVLYFRYRHEVVWWEYLLCFGTAFICIFASKAIIEYSEVSDTEYWGAWITQVRYYEDWNEKVSCRHPVYCESCSTDSEGRRSCYEYVCGHQHAYDVDYHPEYWMFLDSDGGSMNISKKEFDRIVQKFAVTPLFIELNRHYHTNDGDMYKAEWTGDDNTLEAVISQHRYENRVRVSSSSFAIKKPSEEIYNQYKLYDYAPIYEGFKQKVIQGINDADGEKKFQILNAKLGRKKQIKTYVLVFNNPSRQAGLYQEDQWEGGNKNELNIVIGIDNDRNIKWCHVFSWTDKRDIVVNTRTFVEGQGKLNLTELADYIYPQIEKTWVRKNFADFDYLTVEPSMKALIIAFIITLIVNLGMAFFVVANEYTEEDRNRKYNRYGRYSNRR